MAFSLTMYAYVAAKGRDTVKDDPKSQYNHASFTTVEKLTSKIKTISEIELRNNFYTKGCEIPGSGFAIPRAKYFETELLYRPKLKSVYDDIIKNSAGGATIITPNLDHLRIQRINPTHDHINTLIKLAALPVGFLFLGSSAVKRFIDKPTTSITIEDVRMLVHSSIDGLGSVRNFLDGWKRAGANIDENLDDD